MRRPASGGILSLVGALTPTPCGRVRSSALRCCKDLRYGSTGGSDDVMMAIQNLSKKIDAQALDNTLLGRWMKRHEETDQALPRFKNLVILGIVSKRISALRCAQRSPEVV